jgi:glycosyltransferase involved in cell wall biosynthesis
VSTASIVVPAHNEAQVIGRLLSQLVPAGSSSDLDIVVVANGCTDETAAAASRFTPAVRVLSIPEASKRAALAAGNGAARGFPRIYVDADVELRRQDIEALVDALRSPGVLGATTELGHDFAGCRWPVRWYYDVWTRLPEVRRGLFGRGVVALSEAGYERVSQLPPLLADDLAASLVLAPEERAVAAGARVVVHPPRTLRDLLRVRVRAAVGVAQVKRTTGAPESTAGTRPRDLLRMAAGQPALVPRVTLFLAVAVVARRRAARAVRRGDYATWLRDESTRRAVVPP